MKKLTSFLLRGIAGYVLVLLNFPISALVFYILYAITDFNWKQFQAIQDAVIIVLGITNFYFHIVAAQKMKWMKPMNFFLKYFLLTFFSAALTPIFYYLDSLIFVRFLGFNELVFIPKLLFFATLSFSSQYLVWNLPFSNDFPLQLLMWYFLSWLFLFLVNIYLPIQFLGCVLYTFIMKQSIFRFTTLEIWTLKFRIVAYGVLLFINFGVCTEMSRYFYSQDPAGYILNTLFFMGHLHIGLIYVSLSFSLEIQKWVLKDRLMIYPYICFCYFWGIQLAFFNFYVYRQLFVPHFLHKFIGKNVLAIDNLYNTVPSGYIARLFFCLIFSEKQEEKKQRLKEKRQQIKEKLRLKKAKQGQEITYVSVDNQEDNEAEESVEQLVQNSLHIQPEMIQQFDGTTDIHYENELKLSDHLQEKYEIQVSVAESVTEHSEFIHNDKDIV